MVLPDDWSVLPCWLIDDEEFTSVDCWLALVLLETLWSPSPTLMPGLTLAAALMSVLLMPTLAFTPTFGLIVVDDVPVESRALVPWLVAASWEVLDVAPGVPVVEDDEPRLVEPWVAEDDELRSVEPWVAEDEELKSVEEPLVTPVPLVLALPDNEPVPLVDELEAPLVPPAIVLDVPLAAVSGMQSTWTGLLERSLAIPVSLSASLPAFGWLSSLQSGLPAAVVPRLEAVLPLLAVVDVPEVAEPLAVALPVAEALPFDAAVDLSLAFESAELEEDGIVAELRCWDCDAPESLALLPDVWA